MQPSHEGRPFWLPQLAKWSDHTAKQVVRGGVEPPVFRFSGAYAASPHVAGCGLMGNLAAQTMAGCRLMWPDVCRRWLPVWLPGSADAGGGRGAAVDHGGQVIGTVQAAHHRMEAATAAKMTVALDDDLHSSLADETVRSGIGGTGYVIDLSDRGRVPAGIVQRYQAATGGRCRRPGAALTRTNPGPPATIHGREGRTRMPTVRPGGRSGKG